MWIVDSAARADDSLETRWALDGAVVEDIPAIAELLLALYCHETPEMVPADEHAFVGLLEAGLRSQGAEALESCLVVRDRHEPRRLAGYLALACDTNPRKPPFNAAYVRSALRHLGTVTSARVLWRQFKLMSLLCGPLAPKTAQVHSVVVDAPYRGAGLAARLVGAAEDEARRRGQETLLLYILEGNDVEGFYHRLGYRRVHLPKPKFPLRHAGIAMQRNL